MSNIIYDRINNKYIKKMFCNNDNVVVKDGFGYKDGKMIDYYKVKSDFKLSSNYVRYLEEEYRRKLKLEIEIYKEKLEREYKECGEVDKIDFEYYSSLLKKYNNIRYNVNSSVNSSVKSRINGKVVKCNVMKDEGYDIRRGGKS